VKRSENAPDAAGVGELNRRPEAAKGSGSSLFNATSVGWSLTWPTATTMNAMPSLENGNQRSEPSLQPLQNRLRERGPFLRVKADVRLAMENRESRAKEIQSEIRKVLLDDWNPIGCSVPSDEYDTYIGGIYRLLFQGASISELAEHLATIEFRTIGLEVLPEERNEVAAKLSKVNVLLKPKQAT